MNSVGVLNSSKFVWLTASDIGFAKLNSLELTSGIEDFFFGLCLVEILFTVKVLVINCGSNLCVFGGLVSILLAIYTYHLDGVTGTDLSPLES